MKYFNIIYSELMNIKFNAPMVLDDNVYSCDMTTEDHNDLLQVDYDVEVSQPTYIEPETTHSPAIENMSDPIITVKAIDVYFDDSLISLNTSEMKMISDYIENNITLTYARKRKNNRRSNIS